MKSNAQIGLITQRSQVQILPPLQKKPQVRKGLPEIREAPSSVNGQQDGSVGFVTVTAPDQARPRASRPDGLSEAESAGLRRAQAPGSIPGLVGDRPYLEGMSPVSAHDVDAELRRQLPGAAHEKTSQAPLLLPGSPPRALQ